MASQIVNTAWKVIPMFESRSIPQTVDFYTKILGFELASVKPEHGESENGESEQYFCSIFIGKRAEANFYFSKLDDFHVYLKSTPSIEFDEEIEDTPWGFRQFTIKDIDGNLLTFFKFLEGGNPGEE
ncbi:unnamed protein product [Penicillium pancosmium]